MAIVRRVRADGTAAYRVVVHTPTQGHQTIGTYNRKRDAELAEAEYKRQSKLEGVVFIPKRLTFIDLSQEWLNTRRVSRATLLNYSGHRAHMIDYFGNTLITAIGRAECEGYMSFLDKSDLMASSANLAFKTFRRVMQYAVDCGYIKENAAVKVRLLPVRDKRKDMFLIAPQDHIRLVEATSDHFRTLIRVWVFLGLRRGEMLGLKWEDIDLKGRLLNVQRQYTHRGEFADLKSTASYRTVYFAKSVADELRKWKLQCPPSKEGLVFPSPWGGVMTTTYLRDKCIVPLREACDMPELTTHDFRHTFVSYLIADRADIKYIQSQCGHKSAMVTLDTYGHLMQTDEHRHAEGVADWYVTATLPQDAKPQVKGG